MHNKYHIIKNNKILIRHLSDKKSNRKINRKNLAIFNWDNDKYLIINSFKNKTLIVGKDLLDRDFLPLNLFNHLVTPDSNNIKLFNKIISRSDHKTDKEVTFILAITYRCNLACVYCYQKNNKDLNKKIISEKNLSIFLDAIRSYKYQHPDHRINIGLFGGEPLLNSTRWVVDKIFRFCVENLIKVYITTNGTTLDIYLKDIVIHRNIIGSIDVTIDSIDQNHIIRRKLETNKIVKNDSMYLLENIDLQIGRAHV